MDNIKTYKKIQNNLSRDILLERRQKDENNDSETERTKSNINIYYTTLRKDRSP